MEKLKAIRGSTLECEEILAVQEMRQQMLDGNPIPQLVLLFCSPAYDPGRLARAIQQEFPCPVAACTTSGQIGTTGFQKGGLTGVALFAAQLKVSPYFMEPLDEVDRFSLEVAQRVLVECPGPVPRFALLLVDGLSLKEERLVASLHPALDGMAIIGGSAGDDLAFQRTGIYFEGAFHSNAALLVVLQTTLPFRTFKFDHFQPTGKKLVATLADPTQRIVQEFNGKPAAVAYSEAIGVPLAALNPALFSAHPLMLQAGGDYYVRSIQRILPDLSLAFFCAIDQAVVFTLGRPTDALEAAHAAFDGVQAYLGRPEVIIGCDCILRRLELEGSGQAQAMGALFAAKGVVGFSTYGEQWNGMHINQTFTGLALGGGND